MNSKLTFISIVGALLAGCGGGSGSGSGSSTEGALQNGAIPVGHALSVSRSGMGVVQSTPAGVYCDEDCEEIFPANTTVTLTAVPANGQSFTGWTGACTGTLPSCSVVLGSPQNVSAAFTSASAAIVQPGPHAYLDDAEPHVTPVPGVGPLQGLGWPRIGLADSPVSQSVAQLSRFHLIASQNISKIAEAQQLNPQLIYMRMLAPTEFWPDANEVMPFESTGPATEAGRVYAGHWTYGPGTTLMNPVNADDVTIRVRDAKDIAPGSYVVIYDAPAGSFNNAEHVHVRDVNNQTNTLTVERRGFKSMARTHAAGSIVAEHVTGEGLSNPDTNWLYNQSTAAPRDARGNTLGQAMVNWLAQNYNLNAKGERLNVRVDGLYFDVDRHFMPVSKKADVDNDLKRDDGINASGDNMWGEGLDDFYARLRAALPQMLIVGGGIGTRGFASLNGVQWEGFPVSGGSFAINPDYTEVDAQLANYSFHIHNHGGHPSLTHALNKSPTMLYPCLEPDHRTGLNCQQEPPVLTSNAPFRFSFGMSLLDDGFYGQPSSGSETDVWWDEYAVDVVPGSPTFGHAIPSTPGSESRIRKHMGWMGMPLGERVRVYDPASFAAEKSLVGNGGFENGFGGWNGLNLGLSTSTSTGAYLEGSAALHATAPTAQTASLVDTQIQGPMVYLEEGAEYTLAFAVKVSSPRQITVAVGNTTSQALLVPDRWVRRVVSFKASATGPQRLKFLLGRESSEVWLDAVYLFKGNASVFQRDFEHARVVVNATPQPRTVNLGGTFQRITGKQDPINDGSTLQSVTLAPYDAAILVRR